MLCKGGINVSPGNLLNELESKLFYEFKKAMSEVGYNLSDKDIIKKVKAEVQYFKLNDGEIAIKSGEEYKNYKFRKYKKIIIKPENSKLRFFIYKILAARYWKNS